MTPHKLSKSLSNRDMSEVYETITRLQCDLKEWKGRYHDLEKQCVVLRSQNLRLQQLYSKAEATNSKLLLTKIADRQLVQREQRVQPLIRRQKPDLPSEAVPHKMSTEDLHYSPEVDMDVDLELPKAVTDNDVCGQRLLRLAESITHGNAEKLTEKVRILEASLQEKSQELEDLVSCMRYQNLTSLREQCTAQAKLINHLQQENSQLKCKSDQSNGGRSHRERSRVSSRSLSQSRNSNPEGTEWSKGMPSSEKPLSPSKVQQHSYKNEESESESGRSLPNRYLELVEQQKETDEQQPYMESSNHVVCSPRKNSNRSSENISSQSYARQLALMEEENEALKRALARAKQKYTATSTSTPKHPRVLRRIDQLLSVNSEEASIGIDIDYDDVEQDNYAPGYFDSSKDGPLNPRVRTASRDPEVQKEKGLPTKARTGSLDAYAFGRYRNSESKLEVLSDVASSSLSKSTIQQSKGGSSRHVHKARPSSAILKCSTTISKADRPKSAIDFRFKQNEEEHIVAPFPKYLKAHNSKESTTAPTGAFR